MSASRIMAIAVCGVLASVNSEHAWYSFIKKLPTPVCKSGRMRYCRMFRSQGPETLQQQKGLIRNSPSADLEDVETVFSPLLSLLLQYIRDDIYI